MPPKIIISHLEEHGQDWRPFNNIEKDVKKMTQEEWDSGIRGTVRYLVAKNEILKCKDDDLCCDCRYPPKSRPMNHKILSPILYDACIFDLDAYNEGRAKYLKNEVESLSEEIFAGGVSKQMKEFIPGAEPKVANLYKKPINTESDLIEYLTLVLVHVCLKHGKEVDRLKQLLVPMIAKDIATMKGVE